MKGLNRFRKSSYSNDETNIAQCVEVMLFTAP